jgi:hypothetical protein
VPYLVLIEFDYQPDNSSESVRVVPDDVITDEQLNPTRAAELISLGCISEQP